MKHVISDHLLVDLHLLYALGRNGRDLQKRPGLKRPKLPLVAPAAKLTSRGSSHNALNMQPIYIMTLLYQKM